MVGCVLDATGLVTSVSKPVRGEAGEISADLSGRPKAAPLERYTRPSRLQAVPPGFSGWQGCARNRGPSHEVDGAHHGSPQASAFATAMAML